MWLGLSEQIQAVLELENHGDTPRLHAQVLPFDAYAHRSVFSQSMTKLGLALQILLIH